MKKILPLCIIPFLTIVACNSSRLTDWDNVHLKGRVKSVKATSYEAEYKFGEITKGKEASYGYNSHYHYAFNSDGMMIEETYFDDDGDIRFKIINTYLKDIICESERYNDKGLEGRVTYSIDDKRILSAVEYDSAGGETGKAAFEYTDDWLSSIKWFNTEGKLINMISRIRGGNKKIKEQINYDDEGEESVRFSYEYNGKTLTSFTVTHPQSRYNNIRKEFYDKSGFVVIEAETGEIENNEYEMEEAILYEYEYDKAGNWTKRTSFDKTNKTPDEITIRVIEYF